MNFANKQADRIVKEITDDAAPVVVLSVVGSTVGVVVGSSPEPSVVVSSSATSMSPLSADSQPSISKSLTEAAETNVAARENRQIKAMVLMMMCVFLCL